MASLDGNLGSEVRTMGKLKIVPMTSEIVEQVRKTMKAPGYGFPAHREVAAGRAPCRHCLKLIRPNEEELILFTYDAFAGQGVPPMPGPVYVHAKDCRAYSGEEQVPEEYRGQPLTFEAFGAERARLGEKRRTWERRGRGTARIVRTEWNGICACAEHFGGVLFVSGGAGVRRRN